MDSKKSSRSRKPAPASSTPETPKTVPLVPRRRASAVKPARSAQAAAPGAPKANRAGAPVGARPIKKTRARAVATPAPVAAPPSRPATDEEIRVRAYFLALEYAGDNRRDIDFWLIAERELRRRP